MFTISKLEKSSGRVGSDIKLKKNINAYKGGLAIVKQMKPVKYELKAEADSLEQYNKEHTDKKVIPQYISVIAQELQQIAPDLVGSYLDENQEETLSIDMTGLTFLLVNAIKDLNAKVEEQQLLIEALQKKK